MSDALLPCPMCGSHAFVTDGYSMNKDVWPLGTFWRVYCGNCQLRQLHYRSRSAAVAAWNQRIVPEAVTPQLPGEPVRICEQDLLDLLPGPYYMDQPDGGDSTLLEQLMRMARDARRCRGIRLLAVRDGAVANEDAFDAECDSLVAKERVR